MTLRERLTVAIKEQREELDRIRTMNQTNLNTAQARLDELLALRIEVTDTMEALIARVRAAGLDK